MYSHMKLSLMTVGYDGSLCSLMRSASASDVDGNGESGELNVPIIYAALINILSYMTYTCV